VELQKTVHRVDGAPSRIAAAWTSGCRKLSVIANNATASPWHARLVGPACRGWAIHRRTMPCLKTAVSRRHHQLSAGHIEDSSDARNKIA